MGKTEENLKAAFAGESQARNKYTFFAGVARKEGHEKLAAFFEETARNEMEHAELILKLLRGIWDSRHNLKEGIRGETYEYMEMYPEFARVAREEEQAEAADFFEKVATVEKSHAERYERLLKALKSGTLYKGTETRKWRCRACGYIYEGEEAPKECPLCGHPQGYYEPLCETY